MAATNSVLGLVMLCVFGSIVWGGDWHGEEPNGDQQRGIDRRIEFVRNFEYAVLHVAFSPDGTLVAASAGSTEPVRLVDVKTGRSVAVVKYDGWAGRLAFSPDGNLLAVAYTKAPGPSARNPVNRRSEKKQPYTLLCGTCAIENRSQSLSMRTPESSLSPSRRMGIRWPRPSIRPA
jgi:WD40 repeat protein